MEPMLDVSNLSFDYLSASSCLPVIDNISFQAFEGDFISIVGPSGCGKSTLLDIIAGLMPSSAGQVFFLGEPVIKPRKEIGYMLQRDHIGFAQNAVTPAAFASTSISDQSYAVSIIIGVSSPRLLI